MVRASELQVARSATLRIIERGLEGKLAQPDATAFSIVIVRESGPPSPTAFARRRASPVKRLRRPYMTRASKL